MSLSRPSKTCWLPYRLLIISRPGHPTRPLLRWPFGSCAARPRTAQLLLPDVLPLFPELRYVQLSMQERGARLGGSSFRRDLALTRNFGTLLREILPRGVLIVDPWMDIARGRSLSRG
jgi:hypothetical protein